MMIVVLLVALVALVIFIERTLFLHRSQIRSKQFIDGIKNALTKRRIVASIKHDIRRLIVKDLPRQK